MKIKATEVANVWGTECREVKLMDWLKQTCTPETPKKNRPALMPHGIFFKRSAQDIFYHSGLIQIDIDAKENLGVKNWPGLRNLLGQQPHVLCSSISASGAGIYVLVMIHPGQVVHKMELNQVKEMHRKWAEAAMDYIDDVLGEEMGMEVWIDRKVSNNLASLRFMSSDQDMWVNMDAVPLLSNNIQG